MANQHIKDQLTLFCKSECFEDECTFYGFHNFATHIYLKLLQFDIFVKEVSMTLKSKLRHGVTNISFQRFKIS